MWLCLRGATHLQKASSVRMAMESIKQSTETMIYPAHLHVTMEALLPHMKQGVNEITGSGEAYD